MLTLVLAASATMILLNRGAMTESPEDETPARTDALGDPLPEGAIARLGTVRFRHGGAISFLTFTPDEKRLVSKGIDGVRVWEAATDKELWHRPLARLMQF